MSDRYMEEKKTIQDNKNTTSITKQETKLEPLRPKNLEKPPTTMEDIIGKKIIKLIKE